MFDLTTLYAPGLEGPGTFVVVEGLDGSGKSIQIKRLIDRMLLDGHYGGVNDILSMRQPTQKQYGQKIRQFARSSDQRMPLVEFTLFLADRMEQAQQVRDCVHHGEVVVMDRCYHSSVAYQSTTSDLDQWSIYHSNRIVFPKPDLLIVIDTYPDVAVERLKKRGGTKEVFENTDFFSKIRWAYLEMAQHENGAVVNGNQTIDQVEEDIWKAFTTFWPNHPRRSSTG